MHYIDIASALLAPITAIFLAWLAFKDYQTKTKQFKLSLYDRRYKVYKAIETLLRNLIINKKSGLTIINEFIADTNECEFLFNNEITEYIDKIRDKTIHLKHLERKLSDHNLPVGEERIKLTEEDSHLVDWFGDQFNVSKKLFRKYLGFKK